MRTLCLLGAVASASISNLEDETNNKKKFRINGYAGSVILGNSKNHHQDFREEVNVYYDTKKSDALKIRIF